MKYRPLASGNFSLSSTQMKCVTLQKSAVECCEGRIDEQFEMENLVQTQDILYAYECGKFFPLLIISDILRNFDLHLQQYLQQ